MTRINCIDPAELTTPHLVAEYRELPRIFGLVRGAIERWEKPNLETPSSYCMGKGHVRFFYPRLGYLVQRYQEIVAECIRRGVKVQFTDVNPLFSGIPREWFNNWWPTEEDKLTNLERLVERDPTNYKENYEHTRDKKNTVPRTSEGWSGKAGGKDGGKAHHCPQVGVRQPCP